MKSNRSKAASVLGRRSTQIRHLLSHQVSLSRCMTCCTCTFSTAEAAFDGDNNQVSGKKEGPSLAPEQIQTPGTMEQLQGPWQTMQVVVFLTQTEGIYHSTFCFRTTVVYGQLYGTIIPLISPLLQDMLISPPLPYHHVAQRDTELFFQPKSILITSSSSSSGISITSVGLAAKSSSSELLSRYWRPSLEYRSFTSISHLSMALGGKRDRYSKR